MRKISITILIISGLARLAGLMDAAIWYDESYTLALSRLPIDQIVTLSMTDYTPPLWEILLHAVPGGLIAIRLAACAISLASLWLISRILDTLQASDGQRILTALLTALPGLFWQAQDARVYAFASFLILTGIFFLLRRGSLSIPGVWLASAALLFAHNTGVFFAAALGCAALVLDRARARAWALSWLALAVIYIPLMFKVFVFDRAGDYYMPEFTPMWFLGQSAFGLAGQGSSLVTLLLCLAWFTGISIAQWRAKTAQELALWMMAVLPLLALVMVSAAATTILIYRTFSLTMWPGLLFVGTLAAPQPGRRSSYIIPAALCALTMISVYGYNAWTRGGSLDYASALVAENWREGDCIYHATGTSALPMVYYLPGYPAAAFDQFHLGSMQLETGRAFGINYQPPEYISGCTRAWLVWTRMDVNQSPELVAAFSDLVRESRFVWKVDYLQAVPIEIYLKQNSPH